MTAREQGVGGTRRGLLALWLVLCALVPLSTVYFVWLAFVPIQWSDQWVEVAWLEQAMAGNWSIADLWRSHYEHPIAVPRLFFLIDLLWFDGTNRFLVPLNLLIVGSVFLCYVRLVKGAGYSRDVVLALAGVYAVLVFSATQMENLFWGFQTTFLLVLAAGVGALTCFSQHLTRAAQGERARGWLIAAISLGLVCTLSMANGILIWPVMILMGLLTNTRKTSVAIVVGVALPCIIFWQQLLSSDANLGQAVAEPVRQLLFVCIYLGTPWSSLSLSQAGWHGAIGLALATVFSLRHLMTWRSRDHFDRVHIAVLWFTVGGAVATAAGRSQWGADIALNVRYSSTALVFWASVLSLLLPRAADGWKRARRFAFVAVALYCLALLVPAHLRVGDRFIEKARENAQDSMALVAGVHDEEAFFRLCEIAQELPPNLNAFSREQRLGIFAQSWTQHIGAIHRGNTDQWSSRATGGLLGSQFLDAPSGSPLSSGVRLSGGLTVGSHDELPERILVRDLNGRIRGAAALSSPGPFWSRRWPLELGWRGYARAEKAELLWAATSHDGDTGEEFLTYILTSSEGLESAVARDDWEVPNGWVANTFRNSEYAFSHGYAWASTPQSSGGSPPLRSGLIETKDAYALVVPVLKLGNAASWSGTSGVVSIEERDGTVRKFARGHGRPGEWVEWLAYLGPAAVGDYGGLHPAQLRIVAHAPSTPGDVLAIGEPRLVPKPASD